MLLEYDVIFSENGENENFDLENKYFFRDLQHEVAINKRKPYFFKREDVRKPLMIS